MPEVADSQSPTPPPVATRFFGVRLRQAVPFGFVLMALWLMLSPKRDLFHLSLGVVTVLVVTMLSGRLAANPPVVGAADGRSLVLGSWFRFLRFLPWLAWQVVAASLQVAYIVLHPRLPVSPCVVRIKVRYPHMVARLTLANSITLTPGTVTLDVEGDVDGDEFLVHALTGNAAADLEQGAMSDRVLRLFDEPAGPHGS